MKTKICSKCHVEKSVTDFYKRKTSKDGFRSSCKECENNVKQNIIKETKVCSKCHVEKNIENFYRSKQSQNGFRPECKECSSIKRKQYYKNNKETIKQLHKNYNQKYEREIKKYKQSYYQNNKEQIKKKHANYYQKHKNKIKEQVKEYRINHRQQINQNNKERKRKNCLFKFKSNIRNLISVSLQKRGYSKSSHTYEILGISYEDCLNYLFKNAILRYPNFKDQDFLKENCYQIHHRTPLHTGKSKKELIELNHYTNLELLTVEDHQKVHSGGVL